MSTQPYAKVSRGFWSDPEIRRLTAGQRVLLLYYISSPHGNMAGLFYQPFEYTAAETGLEVHTVKRWTFSILGKWVTYDLRTQEILVHNAARYQAGALKPTDRRFDHIKRLVTAARSPALREKFAGLYPEWDVLPEPLGDELPTEFASRLERHNRRRAQKLRAVVGPVDLQLAWREQNGKCGLCGGPIAYETELTVEHRRPLSRGGSHTQDNVCLAHKRCNSAKGGSLEGASKVPRGSQAAPTREPRGNREASSSSSISSRSRTTSIASQSAAPTADLTDAHLMGLIRQHLYVPDGKAPVEQNGKRYNDGRDVKIIRALRAKGLTGHQIADAIEGLRLMCETGELGYKRPGEKLTMRALFNTRHGVRPLLYQAQEACWRSTKRPERARSATEDLKRAESAVRVGDVIDRVLPRKP